MAQARWVTCPFCKQKFDRAKQECVQVASRRYAHPACYQQALDAAKEEAEDLHKLEEYIKELFNIDNIPLLISKQIKNYKENQHYSYKGILKSLQFFYKVQGNSVDKSNGGIGIVPYIYEQAHNYFANLWMIKEQNKDKEVLYETEKVYIHTPKVHKRYKGPFAFLMEVENDSKEE